LVLAGILERQADELKAAYAASLQQGHAGARAGALEVTDSEDGWILMTALLQ
jgi:ribosomal protein L11 methyltransferase